MEPMDILRCTAKRDSAEESKVTGLSYPGGRNLITRAVADSQVLQELRTVIKETCTLGNRFYQRAWKLVLLATGST